MTSRKATAAPAGPALDPCTLGRPVHLLGRFTNALHDEVTECLRVQFNRPYRAAFEAGPVTMARQAAPGPQWRWLRVGHADGPLGFAIDRRLLLCILGYRYGTTTLAAESGEEPETATEERLAALLGRYFADLLAKSVVALSPALVSGSDDTPAPHDNAGEVAAMAPPQQAWTVRIPLREATCSLEGDVLLTLDDAWMARILHRLAPAKPARPRATGRAGQPFPARLHITLVARLMEKELPLGSLLDARVGDVIPMRLGPTDVLADDSLLFRASIAEHKGKLCLTCFEDVE